MKNSSKEKQMARERRKRRVRAKVIGTAAQPRLSVFRSAGHVYAQVIDDAAGKTLASASDLELDAKGLAALRKESDRKGKVAVAFGIGKLVGERAAKKGVTR